MEYKIVEKAEDPKDIVIEKSGISVKFTVRDIETHVAQLNKLRTEIKAKVDYDTAKMTNIEVNHPFVKDMSDQDLFTAHMYQDSKAIVAMGGKKIEEIDAQLKEYEEELAEIVKQAPEVGMVPSPAEFIPEKENKEGGEDGSVPVEA